MKLSPFLFIEGFQSIRGKISAGDYRVLSSSEHALLDVMAKTPQNPEFHQEGDVLSHTKLVLEEMEKLNEFQNLTEELKKTLRLAAFFHDAGKSFTTKLEEGRLRSIGHSNSGEVLARILMQGLVEYRIRETVTSLVRQHTGVPFFINRDSPEDACVRFSLLYRYEIITYSL